jgi:hypothetical protein
MGIVPVKEAARLAETAPPEGDPTQKKLIQVKLFGLLQCINMVYRRSHIQKKNVAIQDIKWGIGVRKEKQDAVPDSRIAPCRNGAVALVGASQRG